MFDNSPKLYNAYENAFSIAKGAHTINTYNKFIDIFPSHETTEKAIKERDGIIILNYWQTRKHNNIQQTFKGVDNFCLANKDNVMLSELIAGAYQLLIQKDNGTETFYKTAYNALHNNDLRYAEITNARKDYMHLLTNEVFFKGIDFDLLKKWNENKTDDIQYFRKHIKPEFEKFTSTYSYVIKNYPKLDNIKDLIKSRDDIHFYGQVSEAILVATNYNDFSIAEHKKNLALLNTLSNKKYINLLGYEYVSGVLDLTINVDCSSCSGTGKVPEQKCHVCKGRGTVRCTNSVTFTREESAGWGTKRVSYTAQCIGGTLRRDSPYFNEICTACNGSGQVDCEKCNGWGVITECDNCNGYGYLKSTYGEYYSKVK